MNLAKKRIALFVLMAIQGANALAQEHKSREKEDGIEDVFVYGEQGQTDTATKLDLTLFETPQTVTAISRAQMDDFSLNSLNDVLNYTPGVTVEEVETNRTYYTARGFDIVNFQYDGVGVPFINGLNVGKQDAAIYEKVEVVKGAAGLITGLANPSATINYVRKRPTEDLQIGTRVSVNEWGGARVDSDVGGSLAPIVRGRLVVAKEDGESYLDRNKSQTDLVYGILEADLSSSTLLTVGHSYEKNQSDGVLWGALPLLYTDGSRTDYDVSTSTAPDWTYADTTQNQIYLNLRQELGSLWAFNAIYTHNRLEYQSELFYVYGTPNREEIGLAGLGSAYDREEKQNIYDVFFSGRFSFIGREHELVVGYSHSDTDVVESSFYDNINGSPVLGSDWAEGNTPQPNFVDHDPAIHSSDTDLTQKALYVSSRLNLSDQFSLLLGARRAELNQEGVSYGGSTNADGEKTVPYFGLTFRLVEDIMFYASYSEVFKQQTFVNVEKQPLGPNEGDNTEIGVKKSFNNERAVLTFALFESSHSNLGEFVNRDADGISLYKPVEIEGEGFELEFSGEVIDGLNIGAGFTHVKLENEKGEEVRPYIPSNLLKLSTSYQIPGISGLRVGGTVKWQDDTAEATDTVEQSAYTLLDLALHYELNKNIGFSVNINNVTDEKYLNSLYWSQAYYGAPRNVQASVSWKF